jgi:hypothetical protein
MVRGRPSGLKAAPHRLRRRPAAGLDPGASAAPRRQEPEGQAKACPPLRAPPRHGYRERMVDAERVIYRHCCNHPLSSRSEKWAKVHTLIYLDCVWSRYVAGVTPKASLKAAINALTLL